MNTEDDFMFSNIIQKKITQPNNSTVVKKSQLKKQKYSRKIIQKRNRSAGKPMRKKIQKQQSAQLFNMLPEKNESDNKSKQFLQKNQYQQSKNLQNNSRLQHDQNYIKKQNIKRPYTYAQKKQKRLEYSKRDKPIIGKIDLNLSKNKMMTPKQVMPEKKLQLSEHIDKKPIQQLHLHKSLQSSLLRNDITKLTQIQIMSYPHLFANKNCIIKAATGSGKTLAYLIPILNKYLQNKTLTSRDDGTTMIIICPTRQLCIQGQKQALRCLKRCPFIVPGCLVGGQQTNHQKIRIRKGISLLFATPGRILYHLQNTQSFDLSHLKTVIFQEADRTLDMGFQKAVNEIIQIVNSKISFDHVQKVLVSAHFNQKVQNLISNLNMEESTYIGFKNQEDLVDKDGLKIEGLQDTFKYDHMEQINTSLNLKQQYALISQEERIPFTMAYVSIMPQSKVLIFVNTISQVQYLDFLLTNMCYRNSNGEMTEQRIQKRRVFKIHGDLDQKLRTNTYFQFRKQKYAIMVSTEVASRGLDFPDLTHIILFDVPQTITDYGNRIGRSARFNSTGVSLMLLHYQQSDFAQKIRFYNKQKHLQTLSKDLIYDNFANFLLKLNIRQQSLHYLEGIVRSMVKDDEQKYQLARKAYVSMLRAYARLKDKHIFAVKKLNLKLLARSFGLNNAKAEDNYNPQAKESHFQALKKRRKVQSVRKMQVDEYL